MSDRARESTTGNFSDLPCEERVRMLQENVAALRARLDSVTEKYEFVVKRNEEFLQQNIAMARALCGDGTKRGVLRSSVQPLPAEDV